MRDDAHAGLSVVDEFDRRRNHVETASRRSEKVGAAVNGESRRAASDNRPDGRRQFVECAFTRRRLKKRLHEIRQAFGDAFFEQKKSRPQVLGQTRPFFLRP
ncbi:hypothetical protein [Methylocella sp.]|uniref:hypothetical protein n=1 Tax=Methylocella sp. TaxID=1978226 RepID=UPI003782F5DA